MIKVPRQPKDQPIPMDDKVSARAPSHEHYPNEEDQLADCWRPEYNGLLLRYMGIFRRRYTANNDKVFCPARRFSDCICPYCSVLHAGHQLNVEADDDIHRGYYTLEGVLYGRDLDEIPFVDDKAQYHSNLGRERCPSV